MAMPCKIQHFLLRRRIKQHFLLRQRMSHLRLGRRYELMWYLLQYSTIYPTTPTTLRHLRRLPRHPRPRRLGNVFVSVSVSVVIASEPSARSAPPPLPRSSAVTRAGPAATRNVRLIEYQPIGNDGSDGKWWAAERR